MVCITGYEMPFGTVRASRHVVKGFALLIMIAGTAWAQDEAPAIFRSDTPLVELHATVFDKDGRLLPDLSENVFRIFENGVAQQIKVFRREDAPVSIGFVVDHSVSMKEKRDRVAVALGVLLRSSNSDDEAFVVGFNQTPELVREFNRDAADLQSVLSALPSGGETALRDAVDMAIDHAKRNGHNEKKVLVVVTDGEDNSSVTTLESVMHDAQQSGVLIYAIGLLGSEHAREAERARRDLDALVQSTGGEVFYPKELSEVDEIARRVAHDLRNQYTIAYNPSNARQDGSYRAIEVRVLAPADAVVKTRAGYYATEDRGVELRHCDASSNSDSNPLHSCGSPAGKGDR